MGLLDRLPFRKRQVPKRGDVRLAMVTLSEAAPLDAGALARALTDVWPHHPPLHDVVEREGTLGFRLGSATVMLGLMPTPIPWRDLELVAACASDWPDAAAVLQAHRAQHVVSLTDARRDRVEAAMWLTWLVAAVAQQPGATGVYWGEGPQVSAAATFVEAARGMTRQRLPLHQWLSFQRSRTGEGRVSLATSGMHPLGHLELELVDQRADAAVLVDRAFDVAHYLLEREPVLKDGDTLTLSTLSAEEHIRVRRAPSVLDPQRTVYRLEL